MSHALALRPSLPAFLLALALDLIVGEPPNAIHPVVWMGRAAEWSKRALGRGPVRESFVGIAIALLLPLASAGFGALVLAAVPARASFLALGIEAWLLKSCFALRALVVAGTKVARALDAGELDAARSSLRSLCSRDPQGFDQTLVAAAAIESLAENSSDSIIAPFLYYACLGLPGALFYRAVNTLDAMIGYHGRYEFLGKASARLDDVLNLVPARLTAALLLLSGCSRRAAMRGARVWRADAASTESPNAGRPMAAMAGLLGVALEKPGHYRLFASGAAADSRAIDSAAIVVARCAGLGAAFAALLVGVRHGF